MWAGCPGAEEGHRSCQLEYLVFWLLVSWLLGSGLLGSGLLASWLLVGWLLGSGECSCFRWREMPMILIWVGWYSQRAEAYRSHGSGVRLR